MSTFTMNRALHVLRETSSKSGSTTSSSSTTETHKNESFFKSAWHKLTHQHDNLPSDEPKSTDKSREEEPKKASGSG